jgi:hypothetical protein
MTDTSVNSSQKALSLMAQDKWITYLPTANIPDAVASLILQNSELVTVFNKSIYAYERDDFTASQIPGMSIYNVRAPLESRLGDWIGDIYLDMYFPIFADRTFGRKVFDQTYDRVMMYIRDGRFMVKMNDLLVPTPDPISDFYDAVVEYKKKVGSPMMEFAKTCRPEKPYMINLKDIGNVWFGRITVNYHISQQKYAQLQQAVGINNFGNPNKMVYGSMDSFEYDIEVKNINDTESLIIEG